MTFLSLDLGTTHCKAGLFSANGCALAIASRPTGTRRTPGGGSYYDPAELWATAVDAITAIITDQDPHQVQVIGVTGMAETGLLLDRLSGIPRSPLVPWFDTAATPQAEELRKHGNPYERFHRTGMRPNFKSSLAKILQLRVRDPGIIIDARWLGAPEYLAYRLCGQMGTDYSLAGRTQAFQLDRLEWDGEWLAEFGLEPELFAPVHPSGFALGGLNDPQLVQAGLPEGIPVAVSGHDHLCAAFAAGAVAGGFHPGIVFDSMGTAEALIGIRESLPLTVAEYRSGLAYGCHVAIGRGYWMGGLSTSGGSIEWYRTIFGDPALTYAELEALLEKAPASPTGILFFPYLAGSGSPHSDLAMRAAFIGLDAAHRRADLLKAVLEGAAYELEYIRQVAQRATGLPIEQVLAAGGGTRNPVWLQIKADVFGCRIEAMDLPEATLRGAALAAALGSGIYKDESALFLALTHPPIQTFLPDPHRQTVYRRIYESGFLPLQEPLRAYFNASNLQSGL